LAKFKLNFIKFGEEKKKKTAQRKVKLSLSLSTTP
jgi:hypothetical protein